MGVNRTVVRPSSDLSVVRRREPWRLAVGTRLSVPDSGKQPSLTSLTQLLVKSVMYADNAIVAVRASDSVGETLLKRVVMVAAQLERKKEIPKEFVVVLPVVAWSMSHGDEVTPGLNAILREASHLKATYLLYQSVEVQATAEAITLLHHHLTSDTLVVGAAFPGMHVFEEGVQELNGLASPWNTLAMWNLSKLAITGFLSVSDGLYAHVLGGVEEVPVIALLQHIRGEEAKAKLILLNDALMHWTNTWDDASRVTWHKRKMNSKLERARGQMEVGIKNEGFDFEGSTGDGMDDAFDGDVEKCLDESFTDGGIRVTGFNLEDELEDGHFDRDGNYCERKDEEEKDAWFESHDFVPLAGKARAALSKRDKAQDQGEQPTKAALFQELLAILQPGETSARALKRLAPSTKPSTAPKPKLQPNDPFSTLTTIVDQLASTGYYDVYHHTREQVKLQADKAAEAAKQPTPSGTMWRFKWTNAPDAEVHGPYSTKQMLNWKRQDYFASGVLCQNLTKGPNAPYYSSKRIVFDDWL